MIRIKEKPAPADEEKRGLSLRDGNGNDLGRGAPDERHRAAGSGEREGCREEREDERRAQPCTGLRLGTVTRTTGNGDSEDTEEIAVFSRIVRLPRHRGHPLELLRDGALLRRFWY